MKKISLNELPTYSHWAKDILSSKKFKTQYKTEEAVLREFDIEKWGELLRRLSKLSINLCVEEVDLKYLSGIFNETFPTVFNGDFYLATGREIFEFHLDLYQKTINPYINKSSCLVELGAGYGSKIFNLSERNGFSELPLYAGELTNNGCRLISLLADSMNKKINVGHCDFKTLTIDEIDIPEDAIIFTSYAVHYVPELSERFVDFFAKLKPLVVIHFEPCYEHHSPNDLYGMMCRKYIEINDYNRNIVSILKNSFVKNDISLKITKNKLASNPLLPISIIEWSPLK